MAFEARARTPLYVDQSVGARRRRRALRTPASLLRTGAPTNQTTSRTRQPQSFSADPRTTQHPTRKENQFCPLLFFTRATHRNGRDFCTQLYITFIKGLKRFLCMTHHTRA